MLEQKFRNYYQQLLVNPCANYCKDMVTPNQVTYYAGISGILVIPTLYWQYSLLAVIFLCISGFLDTLDGTIARMKNSSSNYGSALDITIDRVVEFAAIFGLFLVSASERGGYALLMLGSSLFCVTTFLVVGIFTPNDSHKSFHYSAGLMERAEAFVFFIIMMLWPGSFKFLAVVYTILVFLTGIIRLKEFKDNSK